MGNMRQKEDCPLYHKALLSVAEAAAYTGIGIEKIYEYAEKERTFPATREGRLVKINRQCLDEWLRSRALRRAGFPQFTVCRKV